MCDIVSDIRRYRYKTLRLHGYERGFAQRARDFTDKRYNDALLRDKKQIEAVNDL